MTRMRFEVGNDAGRIGISGPPPEDWPGGPDQRIELAQVTMSVGAYTIREDRNRGDYVVLSVTSDLDGGREVVQVTVALPSKDRIGRIHYGTTQTTNPDLIEALALALDRAATILRDAQEEAANDGE